MGDRPGTLRSPLRRGKRPPGGSSRGWSSCGTRPPAIMIAVSKWLPPPLGTASGIPAPGPSSSPPPGRSVASNMIQCVDSLFERSETARQHGAGGGTRRARASRRGGPPCHGHLVSFLSAAVGGNARTDNAGQLGDLRLDGDCRLGPAREEPLVPLRSSILAALKAAIIKRAESTAPSSSLDLASVIRDRPGSSVHRGR